MHPVQQVRLLGRSGAARRPLHPPSQRGQREDLRLPLVLVRHSRHPDLHHPPLPSCHHLLPKNEGVHDEDALQTRAAGQRRHHRPQKQNGRLVLTLHLGGELRLGHIPGYNARVCEQTEPQLPASYPRGPRCVTPDTRVGVPHLIDVSAARHGTTGLVGAAVY